MKNTLEDSGAPRVILVNGSPHENGTTARALTEIETALAAEGVEYRRIWIGKAPRGGCTACGGCRGTGRCVLGDVACEIAEALEGADGIVVASPVYYASPNGSLLGVLDRAFYSSRYDKWMKVGASVAVARRGGTTATFDALNKYFTISEMPIVSSRYWNQVHGASAADAERDLEGLHTMRLLGRNMAHLIRCIRLGNEQLTRPEREAKIYTNFIPPVAD